MTIKVTTSNPQSIKVTTKQEHEIELTRTARQFSVQVKPPSESFELRINESTNDINVRVSGVLSATGSNPLNGLLNLTTLYSVAKL